MKGTLTNATDAKNVDTDKPCTGGILRVASRIFYMVIANLCGLRCGMRLGLLVMLSVVAGYGWCVAGDGNDESSAIAVNELKSFVWDFSRKDDLGFDGQPDGWQRATGDSYPSYVQYRIVARDPELERSVLKMDAEALRMAIAAVTILVVVSVAPIDRGLDRRPIRSDRIGRRTIPSPVAGNRRQPDVPISVFGRHHDDRVAARHRASRVGVFGPRWRRAGDPFDRPAWRNHRLGQRTN